MSGAIEFLYCVNYARAFSMRSTDDGVTWSQPVEITAAFESFRFVTMSSATSRPGCSSSSLA